MTICALILAHHKPELLARLVRRLKRAGIASYVHIDAKVNPDKFKEECADTGATFSRTRQPVYWGGFSMIEAVAGLAEEAMENKSFTHFLHISGDTYPTKSDKRIVELITEDIDRIDVWEATPGTDTMNRIANTYLPDSRIGALQSFKLHEERYLTLDTVNEFAEIERIFNIKNSQPFPWRFAKGANWWALRRKTLETCLNIIRNNQDMMLWFRYSSNPDETVFNSLVLNFCETEKFKPCPVFTVWNVVPAPYEFRDPSDLEKINSSPQPFARKFAAGAHQLLDKLDEA